MLPIYSYLLQTHSLSIIVFMHAQYQSGFGLKIGDDGVEDVAPAGNAAWLDELWEEQKRVCGLSHSSSCQDEFDPLQRRSPCCGSCDCHPSCMLHRTCCLGAYESLQHGNNMVETNT